MGGREEGGIERVGGKVGIDMGECWGRRRVEGK